MPKPFFITTAIDYTNGAPHIGHAYEKVLADVLARYHRLKGDDVFFLTGVDQHGQKVQQIGGEAGRRAAAVCRWHHGEVHRALGEARRPLRRLGRHHRPAPQDCVRAILQRLWDEKADLQETNSGGFYSVRQEQFLTDKERGADGEFGPEWGQVEEREEENFYFRLSAAQRVAARLSTNAAATVVVARTSACRAAQCRREARRRPLHLAAQDAAQLGHRTSLRSRFVTYVWFDALVNYISFAGYDPTRRSDVHRATRRPSANWRPPSHVIGKDILIPAHGIYWPIMLKALGFADDEMPDAARPRLVEYRAARR